MMPVVSVVWTIVFPMALWKRTISFVEFHLREQRGPVSSPLLAVSSRSFTENVITHVT
jgi:hypothetical protein